MVQLVNSRPLIFKGTYPLLAIMIYSSWLLSPLPSLCEGAQQEEMGLQGPLGIGTFCLLWGLGQLGARSSLGPERTSGWMWPPISSVQV